MRAPATPSGGPISVAGLYNPQRITAIDIMPGLIGIILTMTMVMFTSVAIVRERQRGNMELLIATSLASGDLMVGKALPFADIVSSSAHWCCC